MTPAYCQPINFIKVYKFAIFLAQNQNRSAYGAARMKGGPFSFAKENSPPYTPQEKGIRLAVSDLNDSYASGMGIPARGGAAFSVAIRFASAPTTRCCAAVGGFAALRMRYTPCRCRSAHLVEVQTNFLLPPVFTMRRAQQCRIRQAVCRRGNVTRASR